jgi:hypothetical protein
MKNILTLFVIVLLAFVSGSSISNAATVVGQPVIGVGLDCVVQNPANVPIVVQFVQYQFSCVNPYNGAYITYTPYVPCNGNCGLYPYAYNQFIGVSLANCNLARAACYAEVF